MHDKWKRVFGTVAVMALILVAVMLLGTDESSHVGIGATLAVLGLFVTLPLLILTTADALGSPLHAPAVLPAPPTPREFTYEFVSTTKDLLTAQEASFREGTGVRRWVRWGPVIYGWFALGIGLATLGSSDVDIVQNALWIAMGAVLIGAFQVYPYIVRRTIRQSRAAESPTTLRFDPSGIEAHAEDGRTVTMPWNELVEFGPQPEGIRFTFEYAHSTWLPSRVFTDEHEAASLVKAIDAWLETSLENAIRDQERKEQAWGLREADFWELIKLLDPEPGPESPAAISELVDALAELEVEEIKGFQDILAEQLFLLDSQEHWEGMRPEGSEGSELVPNEKEYLGVRCLVVASGRQVTRALRRYPDAMPKEKERGMPSLLDAAALAYEKKCGEPFRFQPMRDVEMGSNSEGWPDEGASG